jgi:hypothetical protein
MPTYLSLFFFSLLYVALRAFQQRNVTNDDFAWVVPTSLCMSAVDAFLMINVVKNGWSIPLVLSVGLGGGIGCVVAMKLHKRFVMKKSK